MKVRWGKLKGHTCGMMILYTDGSAKIVLNKKHPCNRGFHLAEVIFHEFMHWVICKIFRNRERYNYHLFWDCISSDLSNLVFNRSKSIFTLKYFRGELKKNG